MYCVYGYTDESNPHVTGIDNELITTEISCNNETGRVDVSYGTDDNHFLSLILVLHCSTDMGNVSMRSG